MTWKEPENREAWQEVLSAYLDGELEGDERSVVERRIAEDPALAEELAALRRTSRLLSEWQVEAPKPGAEFLKSIKSEIGGRRSVVSPVRVAASRCWFPPVRRWVLQAAVFVAGMVIGGLGVGFWRSGEASQTGKSLVVQEATRSRTIQVADSLGAMTPAQADRLLRKTQAEGLKKEVFNNIRSDNWREALTVGKRLWDEYPETLHLNDLNNEETLKLLRRKIQDTMREM